MQKICKEAYCENIIAVKHNANGRVTNNRQVYCDEHFIGSSKNRNKENWLVKRREKIGEPAQRVCTITDCDNIIVTKYNSNGRVTNNQQVYCEEHFVGSKDGFDRVATAYSHAMISSKKKNLPFDLDMKYLRSLFPVDNKCPIFGFEMDGSTRKRQASIDRIIPELGYVKGNVQFISMLANAMKSNATQSELEIFSNYWINKKAPKDS